MTSKARIQRIAGRYRAKVAAANNDAEVLVHFREFVRSAAAQCAPLVFERLEADAARSAGFEDDGALGARIRDALVNDRTDFVLQTVGSLDLRFREDSEKIADLTRFAATEHEAVFDRLLMSSRGGAGQ